MRRERGWSREYWMIYRGPGFLAIVWFGSSSTPHLQSVSSTGDTQEYWERETTCLREKGGGEGGRGAKLYNHRKAWSSKKINSLWDEANSKEGYLSMVSFCCVWNYFSEQILQIFCCHYGASTARLKTKVPAITGPATECPWYERSSEKGPVN